MKIAIDCRFIGKSGIGTYIENVMAEIIKNHPEHEFLLFVEKGTNINGSQGGQPFQTDIKPFSLKEVFCFPVAEINKCDAFFSPYINIPGRIKVPIYSTIHDVLFFDVDGIVSPLGKLFRKFYYLRAIKLSKEIFTVSEFSKSRILHHFSTKKNIEVVYNGVSQSICDYKIDSSRNKGDYFIFVGNIKRHKGLHTLVEAFSQARNRGLKSRLVIVGSNEKLRTADRTLMEKIDKIEGIEFTGWVTNERLMKLVSEAKALVQPSLYEGFGIPPFEAICLGTDIIISDIPVFKELYAEVPNSFFKAGDADDLADKLLTFKPNDRLDELKTSLLKKYNYHNTSEIILNTILNSR